MAAAAEISATKSAFQAALEGVVDDAVRANIDLAVQQGRISQQDAQELRVLPVSTFAAKSLAVGQECYAQYMHLEDQLQLPIGVAVRTTTKEAARAIMENFPAGLGAWLAQLRDDEMPANIAECLYAKARPYYETKVAVRCNSDHVTVICAIDFFYVATIKDAAE